MAPSRSAIQIADDKSRLYASLPLVIRQELFFGVEIPTQCCQNGGTSKPKVGF
jgi:hypothetical protein